MEKDSHYYVMYYLCLAAGLKPEEAYVISYSSQQVDDSWDGYEKTLIGSDLKEPYIFDPIRTAHNGFESYGPDVQEKIYYPFHFLPGLQGTEIDQKMVTQKGEKGNLFSRLIDTALASRNPYRIGITLHALADTYSHANFSGLWSWDNDVSRVNFIPTRRGWFVNFFNKCTWMITRKFIEAVPAVGHVQATSFPDFPYLNWKYFDYEGKLHTVSNYFNFREGFLDLYNRFIFKYAESQGYKHRIERDDLLKELWKGIRIDGNLEKRCKCWQKVIVDFAKKYQLEIPGSHLSYGKTDWENAVVKRLKRFGLFSTSKMKLKVLFEQFQESHYYNFHQAALDHRQYVLQQLSAYFTEEHKEYKPIAIPQHLLSELKTKTILKAMS